MAAVALPAVGPEYPFRTPHPRLATAGRISRQTSLSRIAARHSTPWLTSFGARAIFNPMVERVPDSLDRVFRAVADPTRRAILERLRRKPATVTEIAKPFAVSLNAISKHLLVLERAGLIRREIAGREHHCHLQPEPLREAVNWLQRYQAFWEMRLDALERHIFRRRSEKN